jgi:Domain of unknown function (DUF5658)
MKRTTFGFIAVVAALTLSSRVLFAAEPAPAQPLNTRLSADAIHRLTVWPPRFPTPERAVNHSRPTALVPLYLSLGALEALDAATTFKGLSHGAVEGNPVMSGLTGNHFAVIGVKAAATIGSIWAAERMWKRSRIGAVVLMVAVNGAMAAVVAHNAQVLGR